MALGSLTPAELQARLRAGEDLVVLDVREDEERALCAFEGSVHIPNSDQKPGKKVTSGKVSTAFLFVLHHVTSEV